VKQAAGAGATTTLGRIRQAAGRAVWPKRMTSWDGGGFDRTFQRETVWHDLEVPATVQSEAAQER